MTTRSTHIARRWFLAVGLLLVLFVAAVVAMMWPTDGPLALANADENADENAETIAVVDDEARDDPEDGEVVAHEDGWFTERQASEGAEANAQYCAHCHGDDLMGGVGPALAGDTFWQRWGGESVQAFFEVTRQTMPQDDPGSLSNETYAAITAFVLEVNDFPPGESDLPSDADELQALTIERGATGADAATEAADDEPGEAAVSDEAANDNDAGNDAGEDADADDADAERGDGEAWFTSEQAERGQDEYAQHCAACHGDDLQGDPPLVGDAFLAGYETVGEFFDYTRESMPEGDPGSLDDDTYADVIAFILDRNEFPSGDDELDADDRDAMDDMPLDADADADATEAEDVDAEDAEAARDEDAEAEETVLRAISHTGGMSGDWTRSRRISTGAVPPEISPIRRS